MICTIQDTYYEGGHAAGFNVGCDNGYWDAMGEYSGDS